MAFVPPFCPNRDCPSHCPEPSSPDSGVSWFARKGFRPTFVAGPVPRFQCRLCRKGFSSRTFDIDYWTHRSVDYCLVWNLLVGGSGLRQSSRTMSVSTRLLANRHLRLTRQALWLHSECMEDFRLAEPLVLDGFESFAFSHFHPNNLNLLACADSQFFLGLSGALLRRKGRMTEAQKRRRQVLEASFKAPANAIYRSVKGLLGYGCRLAFGALRLPVQIRSDEKREYGFALGSLEPYGSWREEGLVVHSTTPSKAPRTLENPLFTVNYLDRQLRKDLAEHVREGVRFARRIEHSLERATLHLVHHNYFKRFRTRSTDAGATHAEKAGLMRSRVAELKARSLRERAFGWRTELEGWQLEIWRRETSVPLHPVTPLARHLMTA